MGEQAHQIEESDRQVGILQRDLAKCVLDFSGMQSALEGMVQKVEQIDISAQDRPAVFGSKQL